MNNTNEEEHRRLIAMAEFEASGDDPHPDTDHRPTTIRNLEASKLVAGFTDLTKPDQEILRDFLISINETEKMRCLYWSMEQSTRTKRIARLWKQERDKRRFLEAQRLEAREKLSRTETLLGEAVTALTVALDNRGGVLRRAWRWLFGGLTTDSQ